MKVIEHFEDGYSVEHSFGDPNPDTGNSDSMNDWDNGYECGMEDGKAERTEEIMEIIDEMMGEKDTNGNPIWTTMSATSVIAELKTRLGDSDDR